MAQWSRNASLGTNEILAGILTEDEPVAAKVPASMHVNSNYVLDEIDEQPQSDRPRPQTLRP
jgi:hypothetical protein